MTFRAFATLSALVISAAIPAGPVFAFTAETMPTNIAEMEDVLTSRTWQLRVEDAAEDFCREVYYFRKDGSMVALSGDEEIDHTLTARHLVDARFGGRRLGRTRDHLADDAFPIDRRFIVAHGDLPK